MRKRYVLQLTGVVILASGIAGCDESKTGMPFPPEAPPTIERPAQTQVAETEIGESPLPLDETYKLKPLAPVTSCNLERLYGVPFTDSPGEMMDGRNQIRLSGWVADAQREVVPASAEILLRNSATSEAWRVPIEVSGKRPDVQSTLGGAPAYERTGFSVGIDVDDLTPGTYRAYVVFDSGDARKICDNGRRIIIR